jgi:hypothetical protein
VWLPSTGQAGRDNGQVGEQPQGDDVIEQGGRETAPRLRLPGGLRPPGGAGVLAAAALVVGLAAGYAAGSHQARAGAPVAAPGPSANPSASPAPASAFSFAGSQTLTQDINACSAQDGKQLQLGVQVTNQSALPLTLQTARAHTFDGALLQLRGQWAPCGALPAALAQPRNVLQPGQSTWLTVTLRVNVPCPGAYPVQFSVSYLVQGHRVTISLPGFSDLGQVPYSGCTVSSG